MKNFGRVLLSLLLIGSIIGTAWSAQSHQNGRAVLTFTPSNPPCSVYYVEQEQSRNHSWKVVASGKISPITFVIQDIVPGTYTFRLKGQISSVKPITTISNEFSYTISSSVNKNSIIHNKPNKNEHSRSN